MNLRSSIELYEVPLWQETPTTGKSLGIKDGWANHPRGLGKFVNLPLKGNYFARIPQLTHFFFLFVVWLCKQKHESIDVLEVKHQETVSK